MSSGRGTISANNDAGGPKDRPLVMGKRGPDEQGTDSDCGWDQRGQARSRLWVMADKSRVVVHCMKENARGYWRWHWPEWAFPRVRFRNELTLGDDRTGRTPLDLDADLRRDCMNLLPCPQAVTAHGHGTGDTGEPSM